MEDVCRHSVPLLPCWPRVVEGNVICRPTSTACPVAAPRYLAEAVTGRVRISFRSPDHQNFRVVIGIGEWLKPSSVIARSCHVSNALGRHREMNVGSGGCPQ